MAYAAPDVPGEYYEAGYFDRWGKAEAAVAEMKKRTYRSLIEHIPQPGRLLDVGCAFGWALDAARERGFTTAGVEISEYAARRAAQRHEIRRDIRDFDDASFDVVTLVDVIEHIRDPLSLLSETHRVLKPGGIALLTTPDLSSLSARVLRGWWPYVIPEHLVYFSRDTLSRALRMAGFEPVSIGPIKKSLRGEYVASILRARGDILGKAGATVASFFGAMEIGFLSGDMRAIAKRL